LKTKLKRNNELNDRAEEFKNEQDSIISEYKRKVSSLELNLEATQLQLKQVAGETLKNKQEADLRMEHAAVNDNTIVKLRGEIYNLNEQLTIRNAAHENEIGALSAKFNRARSSLRRMMEFENNDRSKELPDMSDFCDTLKKRIKIKQSKLKEINARIDYRIECTEKRLKQLQKDNFMVGN